MNPIDLLELRYTTTLESTSDVIFYKNIHSYISLILNTDNFISILRQSEKDFYTAVKNNGRTTKKLEQNNLYTAHYLDLFIKIYSPLEDYFTTSDPDTNQDPVALILAFGPDSSQVENWCQNHPRTLSYRKAKKQIHEYEKWIGVRNEYEMHLRQFHADFVTVASSLTNIVTSSLTEQPLYLNQQTGDFRFFRTSGTIAPKTQTFKVLSTLLNSDEFFCDYETLIRSYCPNAKVTKLTKPELTQVIKRIKTKLSILPTTAYSNTDIFHNIKGSGYKLVSEKTY